MKRRIAYIIKYNKHIYLIYYYCMCTVLKVLGLLVKTNEHLVLFNSFAGRKFDDSPRELYEEMKRDPRFDGFVMEWAFHEPSIYSSEGLKAVKMDSFRYFIDALKAKVWITNSSVERGLKFKKKDTVFVNTWHGTPIKKMGSAIADNKSFKPLGESGYDSFNVQSRYEEEVYLHSFRVPAERFLKVGLPRNDILAKYSKEMRDSIRTELGISDEKIVILYCPTFREYMQDNHSGIKMSPPVDLVKWERELGDEYVLLIRAHYEVSKVMRIIDSPFVKDVTSYPVLNSLMIASDVLISDYSSVFFDYSIMDKPMLHFTYDYEEYEAQRGMYFDIRDYLIGSNDEDGLINILKDKAGYGDLVDRTKAFREKFLDYYGDATRQTVDHIAEMLGI